jgi:hypothetical protein
VCPFYTKSARIIIKNTKECHFDTIFEYDLYSAHQVAKGTPSDKALGHIYDPQLARYGILWENRQGLQRSYHRILHDKLG